MEGKIRNNVNCGRKVGGGGGVGGGGKRDVGRVAHFSISIFKFLFF